MSEGATHYAIHNLANETKVGVNRRRTHSERVPRGEVKLSRSRMNAILTGLDYLAVGTMRTSRIGCLNASFKRKSMSFIALSSSNTSP